MDINEIRKGISEMKEHIDLLNAQHEIYETDYHALLPEDQQCLINRDDFNQACTKLCLTEF